MGSSRHISVLAATVPEALTVLAAQSHAATSDHLICCSTVSVDKQSVIKKCTMLTLPQHDANLDDASPVNTDVATIDVGDWF